MPASSTLVALPAPSMMSAPLLKAPATCTVVKVAVPRRSVVLAGTSSVVSALRRP